MVLNGSSKCVSAKQATTLPLVLSGVKLALLAICYEKSIIFITGYFRVFHHFAQY